MSYMRDAVIRLGIEMQPTSLQPPSYQPIIEQEKRLAAIYKERASACISAESTIRAEYSKTAAVLREIVGLERARGAIYGGRMSGGGGAVTAGLYSGGGATTAAGVRASSGSSMSIGLGGGGVGSGWAGSSARFMGQYGNYSPSRPGSGFTPGNVAGGGSRQFGGTASWLMGTYGNYTPQAPAAAASRGSGGSVNARGYDARNSQFNTGNAYWDRMRNRFGYGPFDAIGNQLRGWGGAVGMGVGMYAGAPFGDLGMIAGAATGQMVGQGVGYMATTGVGRQMLIRGAESIATGSIGRGIAGGVAGAAAYSGMGFLGAGVGYSVGAAALPVAAAAAIGYGGNRAVNAIGKSFESQWIWAHNQDRWNASNPQTNLIRSQQRFSNLRGAMANSSAIFDENNGDIGVGFGQSGMAAADAIRANRTQLLYGINRAVGPNNIRNLMASAPEQRGMLMDAANEGIRRRQAVIANIAQEIGFRREGVSQAYQAEARVQSANADVQSEKARIRGAEASIGGASGREKAEFWRITSAISQGARINVEDLSTLESVAGQDNRVKDYVERERRKFYKQEQFGQRLDALFGRGDPDLLSAEDRRDEAQRDADKINPLGEKARDIEKAFDKFLQTMIEVVDRHAEDIRALQVITREQRTAAPGS